MFYHKFTLRLCLTACIVLAITSCSKKKSADDDGTLPAVTSAKVDSTTITTGTPVGLTDTGANPDDMVEGSTFGSVVTITFGTTVSINNPLPLSAGVTFAQSGNNIVVTSKADGVEYKLAGTTGNGSVKIYSDKKFKLTLNGVNITSNNGPAINIQSKKRAFVVLADGTTNSLTDSQIYPTSTEDQKGTFFSEAQLVFSGTGSLTVQGNNKHAIVSDDYIRIRSGSITVTGAVKDGIHTNSGFYADGGTVKITANSDDAIECEAGNVIINDGTFNLTANGHGISASYTGTDVTILPNVTINGGTINITSQTGEGLECKKALTINKGNIAITSADDGLNAGTAININGGYIYLYSKVNDGMDSNGTITITGGKTIAVGSPAPESGVDCDANVLKITGGVLVGIGGTTSAPSTTASTINSVVLGGGAANQLIHIEAADGTEALTFTAPVVYTTMLYSCAKLKSTKAYTIYNGGSVDAGTNFRGLYSSGTYNKGAKAGTFTISGLLTQNGGTISTK